MYVKKNKINRNLVLFGLFMLLMNFQVVFAIDYKNICNNEEIMNTMQIVGYILNTVKILVPLILIVLGLVDFGKASISSDDKALSKATSSLFKRFIAGIIIFFIPTIVFAILNVTGVSNENNNEGSFVKCTKCVLKPGSECTVTSFSGNGTQMPSHNVEVKILD